MKDVSSDHPLFRVLVLMGGGLALSCGAAYSKEGDATNGAAGSGTASGGASSSTAGASGATSSSGGAFMGTGGGFPTPNPLNCPSEQWDCSKTPMACYTDMSALPASCVCDFTRPTSAAQCAASETFVCITTYTANYNEVTWDGGTHVQCACVPSSVTDSDVSCQQMCLSMRTNSQGPSSYDECRRPYTQTCDAAGNCTATAADILRQDGVMCGCADIGLK